MTDGLMTKCKQCGQYRNAYNEFRAYYKGAGMYNTCKQCERINSREKYLRLKSTRMALTAAELHEYDKIMQLYDALRNQGFRPPTRKQLKPGLDLAIQALTPKQDASFVVPQELQEWLTKPLTETPSELDRVYDELRTKYMPKIGIDARTHLPIYDETHRPTLIDILVRFDNYEDTYKEDRKI